MRKKGMLDPSVVSKAVGGAFQKLDPRTLWRNPVMFVVEFGSIITTVFAVMSAFQHTGFWFNLQISLWLWFTVLFANFAEALAEGRGKAQADSLKKTRNEAVANRLRSDGTTETVAAIDLVKGDIVVVSDNETIPSDGEIVEGVALVDESAITGESAPVIRESGGDRTGVTGGTRVLSGTIHLRITANMGDTFLDQMIAMVESSSRRKTPNEVALGILLIGLTALFIVVTITLRAFAGYMSVTVAVPVLVALLVCLMPTTIGGLLPAIGIAGMDRLIEHNVIALSGRAVEASGDVSVVLLDKTGTITLGNRMATEFLPAESVTEHQLMESSVLASLADDTPEGRSIVTLAKQKLGIRGRDIRAPEGSTFVPFTAETRMSGIDYGDRHIRKGAVDAIEQWVEENGGQFPDTVHALVDGVARQGETPLVVSDGALVMGVIRLKDILKQDIKERLGQLHVFGIKSVMITGDNPLTAAAIAAEAGIDDFVAQARPETKLDLIRRYQANGSMVAMIGDGTNDAPALAQADVGVAMNAGTQSAREAANLVDLDSNPTKLLDIVEIGKQILITRGSLTTFSIANDVAKYFAIIPAIFAAKYPQLAMLNVMHLHSPASAILSAVIFNAVIIPSLIPLAMRGVQYHPSSANALLWRNLTIYGAGGLALPFVGIRLIDVLLVAIRVVR
ncbi:K(+)-transporting ATPase subunit B [Candidatus Cryosericum hinesii]|jgi:K+-transporting ATPase ATPase B chain|uniref:Potassium-transporting ATPase ATP-binding subunit n=1 Tax=Candidatus Cryosericum hinesii TaxID=2290915 RepID=A0A398DKV9_9BACT|nr:potassium-transporting ATPase subunit KdpB [Candidatus Cryosericum hinesii]RIE10558.1 K(+)-transporting ATPase subunit B [Candidatus Cryosericum hinesii]RIE14499.1 K(+)-transporting ATPase subunit B [Candidatus Cryosericum hinesii]